jgi:hypothetical protein
MYWVADTGEQSHILSFYVRTYIFKPICVLQALKKEEEERTSGQILVAVALSVWS